MTILVTLVAWKSQTMEATWSNMKQHEATWNNCWLHLASACLCCCHMNSASPMIIKAERWTSRALCFAANSFRASCSCCRRLLICTYGSWLSTITEQTWTDHHWVNKFSGNKAMASLRVFFDPNFFFIVTLLGIKFHHIFINIYEHWLTLNIPVRLLLRNWSGQGCSFWQLSAQQTGRVLNLSLNVSLVWAVLTNTAVLGIWYLLYVCGIRYHDVLVTRIRTSLSIVWLWPWWPYSMPLLFFIAIVHVSTWLWYGLSWRLRLGSHGSWCHRDRTGPSSESSSESSCSSTLEGHAQNSVIFYDGLWPPVVWLHNNQMIAVNNYNYNYKYNIYYIYIYVSRCPVPILYFFNFYLPPLLKFLLQPPHIFLQPRSRLVQVLWSCEWSGSQNLPGTSGCVWK